MIYNPNGNIIPHIVVNKTITYYLTKGKGHTHFLSLSPYRSAPTKNYN